MASHSVFRALAAVAGDLVDRGVFTHAEAIEYIEQTLDEWIGEEQEIVIRRPQIVT